MLLKFNGSAPEKQFLYIGVKENNLVDELEMRFSRYQSAVDLFEYSPSIKIANAEGSFAEYTKEYLTVENDILSNTVKVIYTFPELVTAQGSICMQLVFEKGLAVWQSLTFNVFFSENINPSDKLIEAYPNIINELKSDVEKAVEAAEGAKSYTDNISVVENARVEAENQRAEAERVRAENEILRANAESERISSEKKRASDEESRALAEITRENAESARGTAEIERVKNENERIEAERQRAAAELAREEAFLKLIPQLYAPSVFQIGNDSETLFQITDDTRNNGMANAFNVYVDGEYLASEGSNGVEALVDILPFVNNLNLGYHIITATAVGGGFGIDFKESNHSEIRWYKHKSSSGSVSVTLDAGETSKTVTIEGEYDILTVNGIDGLTDAVNSVIYNDDGSITVNYASDVDVNIVIHYTISIE